MNLRRSVLLAASCLALFAALDARATPAINPETMQCDGSYLPGNATHAPFNTVPTPAGAFVRASIQDASGLRLGLPTASTGTRMGLEPSHTVALWRFDSRYSNVTESGSCSTTAGTPCADFSACGSGGPNLCTDLSACSNPSYNWTYNYSYADEVHSSTMSIGTCNYDGTSCSNGATVNSVINTLVPLGLNSCPNPGTLTTGSSVITLFPASAHFADSGNALATLNGSQYGKITYSQSEVGDWMDLPASYTLSAWIKTTASGANQRVLSEQGPQGYWGFGLNGSGQLRHFDSRESAAQLDLSLGPAVNDGGWHKIDIVRANGSSSGLRYYVDGVQVGASQPAKSTTSFLSNPIGHDAYIGKYEGSGTENFNGSIDEIRILSAALGDDDILLEYKGTLHKYSSDNGSTFATKFGAFNPVPANGTTAATTYLPGETPTATSVWTFFAQGINTVTNFTPQFKLSQDTSKPVAPSLTASPTTINDISWSWPTPSKICVSPGTPAPGPYYQLMDCGAGSAITPPSAVFEPTRLIAENYAGAPNQLECRRLQVTDVWGTSSLLPTGTSAYTLAAAPTAAAFTGPTISTGGFLFSWSANSNPSYTRYEITYAQDPAFTVGYATRAALADNYLASSTTITGLLPGTTYYVRVRAFSGRNSDSFGGTATAYASGSVVTVPFPPSLIGTPQSNSSILWTWTQASGATGYTLLDSPTQAQLFAGAALAKQVSGLTVNTRYDAEVQVDMPSPTPASGRGHGFTYTLANAPVGLTAAALYHSSATFTWGGNGNPAQTYYEVIVASEPTFGVVVATLSVSGTTVTATNLFPGANYYARVHAFNGMQLPTTYAPTLNFTTAADPQTTVSSSPPSPYVAATGLVGSWQFDEGSGLTSADGSGNVNAANFGCTSGGCASTPTFAAGPSGLGDAASFSGLTFGAVLTSNGAPFDFGDDLTVEAWVRPQAAGQVSGAGLVARGAQTAEDFSLDVAGIGSYEFRTTNSTVAVAAVPIAAGQWTHVAGVYSSASGGSTRLYLNGAVAASAAGPAGRSVHAGQKVSIGNRQDNFGAYTLPFYGRVDAVRILHKALSAAEVLADYQGGFVSSVTPPSPNAGVIVALPPDAFGAPAQIYVSGDPVNHPIRVPLAALNAGLAQPPAGLTLVPGSLTEVVPVVGGSAFTGTLGSSATLTLPYNDSDGDNIIDGTNPPLAASTMLMYTLNTTVNRWERLPTSVDRRNRRASGVTPHFSVFALFAPTTIGSSLNGVTVYPVPWKPGSGGRFDGPGVVFARLPSSGRIRILTLAGRRVREFAFDGSGAGTATWDGKNDDGRRAASGVYFARITSGLDNSTALLKFAIER